MILYEKTYERPGNESWLVDMIQIHRNDLGLYVEHKIRWKSSWAEPITENHTIDLDENDLDESQKILDEYLDNNSLRITYPNKEKDGFHINLKKIINNN